jgi:hypothetical protein
MKNTITSTPSAETGLLSVVAFNLFVSRIKNIDGVLDFIFKEKRLNSRFSYDDAAGFFLNLDNSNQLLFLTHAFDNEIDLSLPVISNFKEIGEKYGITDWEQFNQEDVRILAVGFNEINEWDAYPHSLVWVRRWCLYTNNNSIDDVHWSGDRFGCLPNWINYFESIGPKQKLRIVESLINYV